MYWGEVFWTFLVTTSTWHDYSFYFNSLLKNFFTFLRFYVNFNLSRTDGVLLIRGWRGLYAKILCRSWCPVIFPSKDESVILLSKVCRGAIEQMTCTEIPHCHTPRECTHVPKTHIHMLLLEQFRESPWKSNNWPETNFCLFLFLHCCSM